MARKTSDSKHHSNTVSEPAAKCRRALAAAAADGASLSNTAPANYITCKILRSGVDSLYVSHPGKLLGGLEALLETAKLNAQSDDAEQQALASVVLSDHCLTVHGRGKGNFPFVLSNNWYHLQVSRARSERMPMCYSQVGSELLTRTGFKASVRGLNNLVSVMTDNFEHPKVSRIDLCVDVVLDGNLRDIPWEHWVSRSNKINFRSEGKELTGISFGEGGQIMCRIYNKTLEVQVHGKTFFYDTWEKCGWTGEEVWRVEFQFKRDALRELGIKSVQDVVEKINGLWVYATSHWLQLKRPRVILNKPRGQQNNSTRWELYPFWEQIQQVRFSDTEHECLTRVSKASKPNDDFLFVNGLGSITSFMATRGIDQLEDAWPLYEAE
ncbi:MAG: hypothetical protein RL120_05455, partial [Gammaproteobacteria bacterium]